MRLLGGKLNKEKKEVTTAKIALWYTLSNVFAKGIAMLSTPIFTRLLTKSEYGFFSNFTSWESIIVILVTLDFTASIARAKYDFDDRMEEYISSVLLFSNIVTILAYAIIETNQDFFVSLFSMDMTYIRIMFVYIFFSPAYSYLQAKHRIYRKYKFFVAFSLTTALVRTVVSVLLVIICEDRFFGRVCGYVIPISIFNFVLWVNCLRKSRRIQLDCIKFACFVSIPLIPHALSGILLGNSDRIMITNICGVEQNAIYSLAYTISMLANLIWTSMNQAWAPWLYDNIHSGNKKAINKNSKIYLGVFTVLIIGVLLVAPELIFILGDSQYKEARFVMPPVILGCAFQFIYGMYVNLEIYAKKTWMISIGTVSAAVFNIVLNAIFIPKCGYIAAAYTTLVGYGLLFLFHYIIVCKTVRELSSLYERKFMFFIIVLLSIISFISLLLYNNDLIRYVVILVYVFACILFGYHFREQIKKLFGVRMKKK